MAAKCVEKHRRKYFADSEYAAALAPASASASTDASAGEEVKASAGTEGSASAVPAAAAGAEADGAAKSDGDSAAASASDTATPQSSSGKGRKSKSKGASSARYVPAPFLYARIDILSSADGKEMFVNEMELLDCELFFRFNKAAAYKMASAIAARVAELKKLSSS